MASIDPKVKQVAEGIGKKKAKFKPCDTEPTDTKMKKIPGPVLDTLQEHFGTNLKKLRIHTGGNIEEIAKTMKARSFTIGENIYFAKKAFAENPEILAHELTHVLNITGGKVPKPKAGKVLVCKK